MKILLILAVFITAAQARIGFTKAQCDMKYGKPNIVDDNREYKVNRYLVVARFNSMGKCMSISFRHKDGTPLHLNVCQAITTLQTKNPINRKLYKEFVTWSDKKGTVGVYHYTIKELVIFSSNLLDEDIENQMKGL